MNVKLVKNLVYYIIFRRKSKYTKKAGKTSNNKILVRIISQIFAYNYSKIEVILIPKTDTLHIRTEPK